MRRLMGAVFAITICIGQANADPTIAIQVNPPPNAPPGANYNITPGYQEEPFAELIQKFTATYKSKPNDMQKGAVRHERASAICAMLKSKRVNHWVGNIYTLSTTSAGNGVLVVSINDNLGLGTNDDEGLDQIDGPTLIPINSPLFAKVSQMSVGDLVYFSGNFIPDDDDCISQTGITADDAMISPEFLFNFTDVEEVTPVK